MVEYDLIVKPRAPLRCQFGFHSWHLLQSMTSVRYIFRIYECRRRGCHAQKTTSEKVLTLAD